MRGYEKEAFFKSFLLFFLVQFLLLSIIGYQQYKKTLQQYDLKIASSMTECSFDLECSEYDIDFIPLKKSSKYNTLYKENSLVFMLFKIPTDGYVMRIGVAKKSYMSKQKRLTLEVIQEYLIYTLFIMIASVIFSLYTLSPFKKALQLNEELIKDLLHDFNTPIAALKINFAILKKIYGSDKAIIRGEISLKNMESLQTNLRYLLQNSKLQSQEFHLNELINERVEYFKALYTNVDFIVVHEQKIVLKTNKEAFVRIIDNLISNAGKYNRSNGGWVKVSIKENSLHVEDSGVGIKNPEKIFERYYKESERGIGIGLHIVKKLCNDMKIEIGVKTELGKGSEFSLLLTQLMLR